MKASKLIQILAQGIEDFGDLEISLISEKQNKETELYDYKSITDRDVFVTEEQTSKEKEFFIRF